MKRWRNPRRGATRGDVIVVVILVLIGIGLTASFLFRNRGQAAHLQCSENLRRIGISIYEQHGIKFKSGEFTEGLVQGKSLPLPAARITEGYATWAVQLAPFLKNDSALSRWNLALPFVEQPAEVRDASLALFLCPARTRSVLIWSQEDEKGWMSGAVGDYACASGDGDPAYPWTGPKANGAIVEGEVLERDKEGRINKWRSLTSVSDLMDKKGRGLAYTILIGEKHVTLSDLGKLEAGDGSLYDGRHPASYARIGGPGFGLASGPDAPFNTNFGSAHPGFSLFLYADVSVKQTKVDISEGVLGRLIRRW